MSQQVNDTIDDYLKSLRRQIEGLESALKQIVEHSHCKSIDPDCTGIRPTENLSITDVCRTWQNVGRQDGHRCAAEIARKALEK